MKTTENYGLLKPESTDYYDVENQNDNMDKIDAKLHSLSENANSAEEKISAVQSTAETAENIAKGRNQSLSYLTYSDMVIALNAMSEDELRVGQNIYIGAVGVPDLWIYGVFVENSEYTYDTDDAIIEAVEANGYLRIGYYAVAFLETQKVDLTTIKAEIQSNTKKIADITENLNVKVESFDSSTGTLYLVSV